MPRKNININDDLDKKVSAYAKKNNTTYTSITNLALSQYLDTKGMKQRIEKVFEDLFVKELKIKANENIDNKIK